MKAVRMGTTLPKMAPGETGGLTTRCAPGPKQMGFSFEQQRRLEGNQDFLNELFRDALKAAGTVEWLTRALNRKPSYESKINDAIAGRDDRNVQFEWLAPLLDDPDAADVIVTRFNERCGYMPPVRRKVAERSELGEAALEVMAEIKDEEQRELFKRRIAKKVGVRADDVKL